MAFDITAVQQQVFDYLKSNQFAGGGLVVGVTGAAIAFARHLPGRFARWLWRQVTIEVEVTSKDELFDALDFWMSQHRFARRPRVFRARVQAFPSSPASLSSTQQSPGNLARGVQLSPGSGKHILWTDGRPVIVERSFVENKTGRYGDQLEKFVFNLFTRDEGRVRSMFEKAVASCAPTEKTISVHTADGRYWEQCATIAVRCPESLVLRAGLFEDISSDLRRFFDRRDWYYRVGIPHRRGYLFTGPPGNGKTTTIIVLAGMFDAPLCIVDLGSPMLTDDRLRDLLARAPAGAFFLFEDIDAMFSGTPTVARQLPADDDDDGEDGERKKLVGGGVTLSGLLNAIDGVASPCGRVVFMSTNFPEKLDAALIRPGRIDRHVEFGNAAPEQAERMFVRFFDDDTDAGPLARRFADLVGGGSVSMATVQGILIESEGRAPKAVELAEGRATC